MTALAASGCGGSPTAAPQPSAPPAPAAAVAPVTPVLEGKTTASGARGVWRSRGYGWILTVSEGGLRLHHETAAGCHADPSGTEKLLETFDYSQAGPDRSVYFLSHPGETRYLFDRIDRLPDSCAQERPWDAPAIFDVFAATFLEHYAFFRERGVDWPARVSAGRAQVSPGMPERDLFAVLSTTLEGLGDAHVELSAKIGADTLHYKEPNSRTLGLLAARARRGAAREGGRARVAPRLPRAR